MTDRAMIVDRAYRPFKGEHRGTAAIMGAIVVDGFRKVFGLRRKFTKKLIPWGLVALTSLILAGIILPAWFVGDQIDLPLPGNAEFFDTTSVLAILFMALAAPLLLVPDRREGVLAVYLSRPIGRGHYLAAKAGALFTLMMFVYLAPQVLLFVSLAALDGGGFFSYLGANLDLLGLAVVTALAYFALHGSLGLLFAALIPRTGFASGAYLGTLLLANLVSELIVTNSTGGARWVALAAFEQHPRIIRDWLFDVDTLRHIPEVAGFGPWASVGVIAAVVAVAVTAIWAQYRRLP